MVISRLLFTNKLSFGGNYEAVRKWKEDTKPTIVNCSHYAQVFGLGVVQYGLKLKLVGFTRCPNYLFCVLSFE
ncbi:MAG: hypothetical protein OEY86_18345 [Nitrospira sp.]|nr:hypothetical protein [Nitrospira sp.]